MKKAESYFDNKGNLVITPKILMPDQCNPPLKPREWIYWVLVSAENKPNDYQNWFKGLGSRATRYRVRQNLMRKGYF